MKFQIVDMEGIVIGNFSEKTDRDEALKKHCMGMARDLE